MKKSVIKSAKTADEAIKLALDEIGKKRSEVSVEILEEASTGFLGLIGGKDALVRVSYEEDINEVLNDLKSEIEVESFKEASKDYDVKERSNYFQKEEGLEEEKETITEKAKDLGEKVTEEAKEFGEKVTEEAKDLGEKVKDKIEEAKEEVEDVFEDDSQDDETEEVESKDYALNKKRSNIDNYYKAKELLEEILKAMHFENTSVIGNLDGQLIKLEAKVDENDTGIAIGKSGSTLDAIEFIIRKAIDSRANSLRVNVDINGYKKRRDEKIVRLARETAEKVAKTQKSWNLRYMNSYERLLAHEEISKHKNVTSHSEGREPQRYVVVDYVEE
ncbi:Jag N-terminal domain-containing protein [Anaerococcus sp. NML200537]|uniref:RNA-binding cell elongation regulator Jag/EloR n=1 Tax=Anaerococcus sp. NML200537 TaxID=2954485 RepID=UPI002238C7CE|nr:RNA-binding cell elongation regulator Jag/EloR [Anaerococcus sp. NML200537]MCW6702027.1 Jag N-terminal domain-containing protein [Anaerococcus sp. NML200537]